MADGVGTFTEAVSVAGATLAPSSQSNSRLTHTIRLKSIVGFQPYSCLDENCFCCIAIILKCLRCEMSNLTRSMKFFSLCGRLCDSQGIDFNGMREEKAVYRIGMKLCRTYWKKLPTKSKLCRTFLGKSSTFLGETLTKLTQNAMKIEIYSPKIRESGRFVLKMGKRFIVFLGDVSISLS